MACNPTIDRAGVTRPWTLQRIANRLPGWSRARTRQDSVLQAMVNPFAVKYDELYARQFMVRDNYFVPSVNINDLAFAYVLRLPMEFEFVLDPGSRVFEIPTITARIGAESIELTHVDTWAKASPFERPPSRITGGLLATEISDTLLTQTYLDQLGSSSFDNAQLLRLRSKLWVKINGATVFGGETSDGETLKPKVVISGQPVEFDYLDERIEHMPFPVNGIQPTKNIYDSIWLMGTEGINNPEDTTMEVTRGFKKNYIVDPYTLWVDATSEKRLAHKFENLTVPGDPGDPSTPMAVLQWTVPEYPSAFEAEGFDDQEVVYEELLFSESGIEPSFIAIERIPFSRYLILINQTTLKVVSAERTHPFLWTMDDSERLLFIDLLYKNRTPNAELLIDADRTWMNLSEGPSMDIYTHHAGNTQIITSTRLTRYTLSDGDNEIVSTVLDWDGNEINPLTDPFQGFIFNTAANGTANDWQEKTLTVSPFTDPDGGQPVEIFVLETKLAGGEIQKDSILLSQQLSRVYVDLPLPAAIQGKVAGMTYDGEGALLVLLDNGDVWNLNLHYDYFTVDYRGNTVYFREEYDSVSVLTGEDSP